MGRSIVAVAAGFVLTMALNLGTNAILVRLGVIPAEGATTDAATLILVCAYVAVYGILGCYVAARLAPSRPMAHALVLGALALAMSIPITLQQWDTSPAWFNVYNLLAVMPYAWLGGRIRERELERGGAARLAAS